MKSEHLHSQSVHPEASTATAIDAQSPAADDLREPICRHVVRQLDVISSALTRLANHFDPPPPDLVDTSYVAMKLGCTADWIAVLARDGEIPATCLVPGTGNGKPWKFRRSEIDRWIERR